MAAGISWVLIGHGRQRCALAGGAGVPPPGVDDDEEKKHKSGIKEGRAHGGVRGRWKGNLSLTTPESWTVIGLRAVCTESNQIPVRFAKRIIRRRALSRPQGPVFAACISMHRLGRGELVLARLGLEDDGSKMVCDDREEHGRPFKDPNTRRYTRSPPRPKANRPRP